MAAEDTTAQQLEDFRNPETPPFETLSNAVQAPVLTTLDVNGKHGSVDDGGAIDQCVWSLNAQQQSGPVGQYMSAVKPLNDWSVAKFGIPFAMPTVNGMMRNTTLTIISAFLGGYHGYRRSHGKALPTAGYALAGVVAPLLTLGVAAFQGYAKPRR